jgi:hypothetical protein
VIIAAVAGCVSWPTAKNLGHNWLNAVFGVITLPDPIHLNSTDSEIFRTARLAGFQLS